MLLLEYTRGERELLGGRSSVGCYTHRTPSGVLQRTAYPLLRSFNFGHAFHIHTAHTYPHLPHQTAWSIRETVKDIACHFIHHPPPTHSLSHSGIWHLGEGEKQRLDDLSMPQPLRHATACLTNPALPAATSSPPVIYIHIYSTQATHTCYNRTDEIARTHARTSKSPSHARSGRYTPPSVSASKFY